MDRKIKFRGMDVNGIMRYGRLSQDKPGETAYYDEYSQRICFDKYSNIPVSNKTLGQSTGLCDKNVIEIYEGDILRIQDEDSLFGQKAVFVKVVFENGMFIVAGEVNEDGWELLFNLKVDDFVEGVVVGNIFENKNLLN